VIRKSVLDDHPDLEKLFGPVSKKLTNKVLLDLNAQVDVDGRDPTDVAQDWLKKEGFLHRPSGRKQTSTTPIGRKQRHGTAFLPTRRYSGRGWSLSCRGDDAEGPAEDERGGRGSRRARVDVPGALSRPGRLGADLSTLGSTLRRGPPGQGGYATRRTRGG
jgi:hypothetical protein